MSLFKKIRVTGATGKQGYDYLLIPLYGQSLAASTNGVTDPANTTYMKQFSSGLNVPPTDFSTLVPLDKRNDTLTVAFNMIYQRRNALDTTILVGSQPASPGKNIESLSKGSEYYDNLIEGAVQLQRIALSEGKTCAVPCVMWMQGEANNADIDLKTYGAKLEQLISDLNDDILPITKQTERVKLMSYQLATAADWGRYHRIAMEQLDSSISDDDIYLSKAMYVGDYVQGTDWVHGEVQTYGLTGANMGVQIYNELIAGNIKSQFKVVNHFYSNLKSTITFDVPYPPLALEQTEVTPQSDGNYGFKLFDVFESETSISANTISEPTATITSVNLILPNIIEINYSSDPTGSRLTYAVNGIGWEQVTGIRDLCETGRVGGARGSLRDSQGNSIQMDIYDSNLDVIFDKIHNYCPIFEIQL